MYVPHPGAHLAPCPLPLPQASLSLPLQNRHIVFTIEAPGFAPVTTRMYFDLDPQLQTVVGGGGAARRRLDASAMAAAFANGGYAPGAGASGTATAASDPRVAHVAFVPAQPVPTWSGASPSTIYSPYLGSN